MGFVLGSLGGGGGILTVPILAAGFGMSAKSATGASLVVVGFVSLIGAVEGLASRRYPIVPAVVLGGFAMAGAFVARRWLVPGLPAEWLGLTSDQLLMGSFAILMVGVGIRMLLRERPAPEGPVLAIGWVCLIGTMIGLVAGTLGAGGGFLIVPALTLAMRFPMKTAISMSLAVITIQSLGGAIGDVGQPIEWALVFEIVLVALAGMVLGLALRPRLPVRILRSGFGLLVICVGVWTLIQIRMNHF